MLKKCFSNLGLPCRLVAMAAGKETLKLLPPELVVAQISRRSWIERDFFFFLVFNAW